MRERIEKSSASVGSHISFEVGKPTFRVLTLPSAAQLSGKLFYSGRRQSLLTRSRSLRRGCARWERARGWRDGRRRMREEVVEEGKKRSSWDRRVEENWKVKKLFPHPADVLEFNRALQDELYSLLLLFISVYLSIYTFSVFFLFLLLSISRWFTPPSFSFVDSALLHFILYNYIVRGTLFIRRAEEVHRRLPTDIIANEMSCNNFTVYFPMEIILISRVPLLMSFQIKCRSTKIFKREVFDKIKCSPRHVVCSVAIRSVFAAEWHPWAIRRKWTISRRNAYRFRIRTTLLARLKSEARSRWRFYDNWAARGALHRFSRRDRGRNYFRVVSPTGVAPAISGGRAAPRRIHFLTLIIYIYFIYSLSLPTDVPARHRRNVIREKPDRTAIMIFSHQTFPQDSRSIEGLGW